VTTSPSWAALHGSAPSGQVSGRQQRHKYALDAYLQIENASDYLRGTGTTSRSRRFRWHYERSPLIQEGSFGAGEVVGGFAP